MISCSGWILGKGWTTPGLVYEMTNAKSSRKVYRKPKHKELYLNAASYHHAAQKQAVMSTLVYRVL